MLYQPVSQPQNISQARGLATEPPQRLRVDGAVDPAGPGLGRLLLLPVDDYDRRVEEEHYNAATFNKKGIEKEGEEGKRSV